jgi:hypothetical protein
MAAYVNICEQWEIRHRALLIGGAAAIVAHLQDDERKKGLIIMARGHERPRA